MDALGKLEQRQIHILQRITALELHLQAQHLSSLSIAAPASGRAETTESRLSAILASLGAGDFVFRRVASDYYDRSLEERRDIVGAASVHHLCKSILLVNYTRSCSIIAGGYIHQGVFNCVFVTSKEGLNALYPIKFIGNNHNKNVELKK
ncbi:uncharacterized protein M6B38_200200 [Iris pallida]|uniref:Uncharacterized protein n=1 Tax=Iris pallida TaxID=29817 RepID=A0AAX6E969_IRIPA|nr:uncharacterized protein M6B38_200200 [Iris pallida]